MNKNSIKKYLIKNMPRPVKDSISDVRLAKEKLVTFRYDKNRFLKSYSTHYLSKNKASQLEGRITFHAHALEKGLSHAEIRLGFGETALKQLSRCLDSYNRQGFSKSSIAYENALSVIKEYIKVHEDNKFKVDFLNDIFSEEILKEVHHTESKIGGTYEFAISSKDQNKKIDFKSLFINRWSTREYDSTKVDAGKINEAIDIAMKSPSICNRQSSRVTVITEPDLIKRALEIQGGMNGYALPPVLLMVTTDTSVFVHVTERNQVYIDGGLFSMSLLLSLEYVSLAACPLNAMLSVKKDKEIRGVLSIPDNENIIMFISVGNFMENNKVPKSFRYTGDDVSRIAN